MNGTFVTRLAPSPTGALHLGNARTFLINWLLARRNGWRVHLRIDDLDTPRTKMGAELQAIEDLEWLGLDWDSGPDRQSEHVERYQAAIDSLVKKGLAYPCVCTRKEVEMASSAPHLEDGAVRYPGTCAGRFGSIDDARRISGREPAIRFRVSSRELHYFDQLRGDLSCDPRAQLGDFVIARQYDQAAYQLAVVLDDRKAGVTHVVRGDDLLDSTPRQILLHQALGLGDVIPNYLHVPLVVGEDGKRLAKRHGDTRMSYYRERGVPASRLLALLGEWCGLRACEHASINELMSGFTLENLPRRPMVFTSKDDRFLLGV